MPDSSTHTDATDWIGWRDFNPSALAANLNALEKRRPDLRVSLDEENALDGLRLRFGPGGWPEAAVLREDGSLETLLDARTLRGSDSMQESVIRDSSGVEYAAVVWALGCNLGYSLQRLATHLRQATQKIVVALEPDLRLFAATLAAGPYQAALASNRFEWVIGPDWLRQAQTCFERRNFFAVERMEVLPSATSILPSMKAAWTQLRKNLLEWERDRKSVV